MPSGGKMTTWLSCPMLLRGLAFLRDAGLQSIIKTTTGFSSAHLHNSVTAIFKELCIIVFTFIYIQVLHICI